MTNYLPAAVKDPITLSCLLLTGAQCLEKSDQGQQSHHNARHYAGYYRGRLLHSMNQALNDMTETASDSMIAALVKLETDEVSYLHLLIQELAALIRQVGGMLDL